MMLKTKWELQIGDWSGDGHSQCDDYVIESNFTVQEAREAYFVAKKKYPKICPEKVACEWESSLTIKEAQAWIDAGVLDISKSAEEWVDEFHTDDFALAVLNYIKLGNAEFEFKIIEDDLETFNYYGYDKKKRHIGFFGYGLFWT